MQATQSTSAPRHNKLAISTAQRAILALCKTLEGVNLDPKPESGECGLDRCEAPMIPPDDEAAIRQLEPWTLRWLEASACASP
jgi:hypothetical protein